MSDGRAKVRDAIRKALYRGSGKGLLMIGGGRMSIVVDLLTNAALGLPETDPGTSSEGTRQEPHDDRGGWEERCTSRFQYGSEVLRCQAGPGHPRRHLAEVVVSEASGRRTTIWWGDEEAIDAALAGSEDPPWMCYKCRTKDSVVVEDGVARCTAPDCGAEWTHADAAPTETKHESESVDGWELRQALVSAIASAESRQKMQGGVAEPIYLSIPTARRILDRLRSTSEGGRERVWRVVHDMHETLSDLPVDTALVGEDTDRILAALDGRE